ncbi:MAG: ATP-binding cassette domain-containing protein [Chloroflexi bacterium]|nr:ATP-binding cassette domain-containing protein [Chloroflexota bacterium]
MNLQLKPVIEIKGLTKRFGKFTAVDNIDMTVNECEIFGFLGPNGAGKSTALRIMTTLSKPTEGQVLISGYDVLKNPLAVKEQIGVVQQVVSFDRDLSLWDNMEMHARMHGFRGREAKEAVRKSLEYAGLLDFANVLSNDLSGGMRRIAQIVRALMHSPKIIFLDEPTTSLDAQTRRKIWSRIRLMREQGSTVILTTHYIEEAEALCDRVAIIHKGKIIAVGTPLELREQVGLWTVEYAAIGSDTEYKHFATEAQAKIFGVSLPDSKHVLKIRPSNLEDVFIEFTGTHVSEPPSGGKSLS